MKSRNTRKRKVILASASPWRKTLLARAGIEFDVEVSGFDENLAQKVSPKKLVMQLALGKARTVAIRHKDAIIIGADSVAEFKGNILGKPKTAREARAVLAALSGKQHKLITGFAIIDTKSGKTVVKAQETKITFRTLTPKEISAYVATGEPLTVAGGYAIQGGGSSFAKHIEGDFYNIVGLPLASVVEELRKCGV